MIPSEERGSRAGEAWFAAAGLAVYAVVLALATRTHTFWRDESEAWLVARESHSLMGLMQHLRYEGHPPVWYLVLYGVQKVTANPEWMKLPNYLFAVAAAAIILSARQLSMYVRVGLVFSYFLLFEYAVVDRNYMVGIVLLLAAVSVMRRGERVMQTAVLLGLAALTSLPALVVAVCLYALLLWRCGWRRFGATVVFGVCVVCSLAVIRPPKDSGLMLASPRSGAVVSAVNFLYSIPGAYLPVPDRAVGFWERHWLAHIRDVNLVIGFALLVGLCCYFRRRDVRGFFVAASALLSVQMLLSGRAFARHIGWLFVVLVLALVLEGSREFAARKMSWRGALLFVVLVAQAGAGLFCAWVSSRHSFSGSKAAAEFLRGRGLERAPMVFAPDYVSQSVLVYLRRPTAYYVERHALGSMILWDRDELLNRHVPSRAELLAATGDGTLPVLVTDTPFSEAQRQEMGVWLVGSFAGEIAREDYYVYR